MKNGFTLIELIIVCVIIAVIGITSSANYIALREKNILQNTAEQLKAQIQQARTDAINGRFKQNTMVEVTQGVNKCLYVGPEKSPIDCVTDAYPLPDGITVTHPNNQRAIFELVTGNASLNTSQFWTAGNRRGLELRSRFFVVNIWISPAGVVTNSEARV